MTERRARVRAPRPVLSLRGTLLLVLGLAFMFVAVVELGLAFSVVPRSTQLSTRSANARRDFETRTTLAAALNGLTIDIGEQVRRARNGPLNPDSLQVRRDSLHALLGGSSLLSPLQLQERENVAISQPLQAADDAIAELMGELQGVVGLLEIGDVANAERSMQRATKVGTSLNRKLADVTAAAISNLNQEEKQLTDEAHLAQMLVESWLGVGAVVCLLAWWALRRRLFGPLTGIERALTRIERGDLGVTLAVHRGDEMGRPMEHFNRTTEVLRDQRAAAERAAAAEAQAVSDARYRAAFEQAAVGIAEIGLDGRYLQVNRALCRILGREEQEIVGHAFVEFTHPDDIAVDADQWPRMIGEHESTMRFAKRYLRGDGSIASTEIAATMLREPDGTPRHVLSVVQDVTEQQQLANQLNQSKKLDAVGQLAGGVAHDFNNLLTGIIGYAELLEHDAGSSAEVRDDAIAIRQTALRGADLSRSLLALARRTPVSHEPFALDTMLRETAALIRRTFDRRIELELQCDVEATIMGDRSLVSNAVLNLAVNARDAMPDGGTLTIKATVGHPGAELRARCGLTSDGPHAVIAVTDTGSGMTADVLEHLFEPFFTTKPSGKGTGLGLAMVYGTVQDHGGAVTVASDIGRGTTFTVYLPCTTTAGAVPAAVSAPVGAARRSRVLVVDDEELVRDVAARMLRRLGYDVEQSVDGMAALERLAADDHGIDVVLMDGNMPRLNGVETARRLHERHPQLPMIYASGYFQPGWNEDLAAVGFREHLTKPYSMDALSRAVARCVAPNIGTASGGTRE